MFAVVATYLLAASSAAATVGATLACSTPGRCDAARGGDDPSLLQHAVARHDAPSKPAVGGQGPPEAPAAINLESDEARYVANSSVSAGCELKKVVGISATSPFLYHASRVQHFDEALHGPMWFADSRKFSEQVCPQALAPWVTGDQGTVNCYLHKFRPFVAKNMLACDTTEAFLNWFVDRYSPKERPEAAARPEAQKFCASEGPAYEGYIIYHDDATSLLEMMMCDPAARAEEVGAPEAIPVQWLNMGSQMGGLRLCVEPKAQGYVWLCDMMYGCGDMDGTACKAIMADLKGMMEER